MGVPAFYRWLTLKYPKIISDVLEKRNQVVQGEEIPLNLLEPNPNGIEYDNLYVDMNGLIHPCSHPEDREAPLTEAEMYLNITKYVDRLFAAIRPRRLLFLAIDGVAPRAKMNQQRARRFRAAQEAAERAAALGEVISEMEALGLQPPTSNHSSWDSNVITPGTEFMDRLSVVLRFYIIDRMNRNPAWKSIKVILSDSSEPGEGEHKIMKFVRSQRSQPGYDPNQRHILHGLDADLIMLGLATHEVHFTILREEVTFGGKKKEFISEAKRMLNIEGAAISALKPEDEWIYGKPLQCLHIKILREYLSYEFIALKSILPFPYDLERIIDDFVFICFFVGNDFLPHLPSLDIRDGAIDFLVEIYKELLPSMGGYITNPGGIVNLQQVDILLARVGEVEDEVFQRRKAAEDREIMRTQRSNEQGRSFDRNKTTQVSYHNPPLDILPSETLSQANLSAASILRNKLGKNTSIDGCEKSHSEAARSNLKRDLGQVESTSEAESIPPPKVQKYIDEPISHSPHFHQTPAPEISDTLSPNPQPSLIVAVKKKLENKQREVIEKNKGVVHDLVRFHERGWKERYYGDKFKKEDIELNGGLSVMLKEYIKGLCWVLKYYYQGCPSWNWYYPFHYAPFASDLVNVDTYDISFELSEPFRPIEQLLAVLPSDSVHALPECCHYLMLSPESPIADIYSKDIPLDPNGKVLPWLWVVLLPFIDERRIRDAIKLCENEMTPDEKQRNSFGTSIMFIHRNHRLGVTIESHFGEKIANYSPEIDAYYFSHDIGDGICGQLTVREDLVKEYGINQVIRAPSRPLRSFQDISLNRVFCFEFHFPPEKYHLSSLLPNADPGHNILCDYDGIVRRPKLNKGKFNIADIAERMREDRSRSQQSQRFIMAGLGYQWAETQQSEYPSNRNSSNHFQERQEFGHSPHFSQRIGSNHGGQHFSGYSFRERAEEWAFQRDDGRPHNRSHQPSFRPVDNRSNSDYYRSPMYLDNRQSSRFSSDHLRLDSSNTNYERNAYPQSRAPPMTGVGNRINSESHSIQSWRESSSSGSIHDARTQLSQSRVNHPERQSSFASRDPRMRNK